ncbi:MAG TPA: hypothetical protein VGH53_23085, partial [Streptosporangiaceae bacterium]
DDDDIRAGLAAHPASGGDVAMRCLDGKPGRRAPASSPARKNSAGVATIVEATSRGRPQPPASR